MQYSKNLATLIEKLNRFQDRIPMQELQGLLEESTVTLQDVEPFIKFDKQNYARNLIHGNKVYEMLCLCWRPGQRSPIHDHTGSNCCVRVLEGTATVTDFERVEAGYIKPVQSMNANPYTVCAARNGDIHQVSNLEGPSQNLITLHVYTHPQRIINIYDMISNDVSQMTSS